MRHKTLRRIASLATALSIVLLAGCGSDGADPPSAIPATETQSERAFLYEREFAANPALAARQHQVVVLDLAPASQGRASIEHLTRHQFDDGSYSFCTEPGEAS